LPSRPGAPGTLTATRIDFGRGDSRASEERERSNFDALPGPRIGEQLLGTSVPNISVDSVRQR
jgi:hypothetical protein